MTPLFRTEVTEYRRRGALGSVRSSRGPSTGVLVVFMLAVVTAIATFMAIVDWLPTAIRQGQPFLPVPSGISARQPALRSPSTPATPATAATTPVVPALTSLLLFGR